MSEFNESDYEITENVREFILGGKADFTIFQDYTEKTSPIQYKYLVKSNNNQNPTCWFVSTEVVEGEPIPEHLYTTGRNCVYQGYLKRDGSFNVGKKGMQNYNESAINGLLWCIRHADNLPSVVHIYHHGKCSVCGRKLTDAKSLRCGIGPTCRKRVGVEG